MVKITEDIWYWHHNVSECYYHIQLTIKYRRSVFAEEIENIILKGVKKEGFKPAKETAGKDPSEINPPHKRRVKNE